jgi:transposase-like protein
VIRKQGSRQSNNIFKYHVRSQSVSHNRAVDKQRHTVDFHLSEHRDIGSAKEFFTQTIDKQGAQEKITLTVRQQRIPQLVS